MVRVLAKARRQQKELDAQRRADAKLGRSKGQREQPHTLEVYIHYMNL